MEDEQIAILACSCVI